MKPGLYQGVFAEREFRVTPEMCPHFHGVLVHPVYATWTAVHHMELVGRLLLEPHLEPHEEGVGAHLSIDHRSPACIDSVVCVRAEVESCSAHRLTTRVRTSVGERVVAEGVFVQVIMPRARLDALFAKHAVR